MINPARMMTPKSATSKIRKKKQTTFLRWCIFPLLVAWLFLHETICLSVRYLEVSKRYAKFR